MGMDGSAKRQNLEEIIGSSVGVTASTTFSVYIKTARSEGNG